MNTHPLHRRRMALVAVAMLAVIGLAAGCEMAPPPRTSHSPSGYLDSVDNSGMPVTEPEGLMMGLEPWPWPGPAKVVVVRGWAIDWDAPLWGAQVLPAVIQNGRLTWMRGTFAWEPRPDVDAAFPETRTPVVSNGIPAGHGYVMRVPTIPNSTAVVCAVAINRGGTPGDNTILGCETVTT